MHFFTVAELKEMLKLSLGQVYALIDSGRLKCHRFTTGKNGGIRVSQAQLDAYLRDTESTDAPTRELAAPKVTLRNLSLD